MEYAGQDESTGLLMTGDWLRTYGVTDGTTAADWVGEDLTARDLTPYFLPRDDELDRAGVLAIFLGDYFPWDPETSLRVALEHGFQVRAEGPKTGYYNYADIDDDFISVHHYLKWHKFGITRSWDNLSLEIRNDRLTREQVVQILRQRGDETPHGDIQRICEFMEITTDRFYEICEKFRNPGIWVHHDGKWMIPGFLIPDWEWR